MPTISGAPWGYVDSLSRDTSKIPLRARKLGPLFQEAACIVLRDGCVLQVGTREYPLNAKNVARMIVHADKNLVARLGNRPDCSTLVGMVKYIVGPGRVRHGSRDFRVHLSVTSYRALLRHGRK